MNHGRDESTILRIGCHVMFLNSGKFPRYSIKYVYGMIKIKSKSKKLPGTYCIECLGIKQLSYTHDLPATRQYCFMSIYPGLGSITRTYYTCIKNTIVSYTMIHILYVS